MNKRLRQALGLFGPFMGLLFVYVLFLIIAPDSFRTLYNTKTFLTQAVIYGIGALGMTAIIISGNIDLSVGSLIALGTVITGLVLRTWGGDAPGVGLPLLAALAAIGVCALCGLASGSLISGLRIVSFIVTLGMMQIARGVAKGLADQTTVNAPATWLNGLMVVEPELGARHSIAPGVWIMLALLIVMYVTLRHTVFGRRVFAIGANETAARLCGINVALTRIWVFGLGGALTGVASVMQFSNLTLGDPTAAVGMELDIIAAVVIGGGSLSGGEGSVVGSVVGALIMAILRNGCNLVGVPNYVQNIVIGSIIIAAVGVDQLKRRIKR